MELYFNNKTRKNLDEYKDIYLSLFEKTLKHLNLSMNCSMSITFVSIEMIRKINNMYRHIDRATDVISFAYLDDINEKDIIMHEYPLDLGEIYISYDVANKNAKKYKNSLKRELSFLFIHGLLHLLGYDHIKKEDEEIMFRLQDEILPPKEG